MSKKYVIIGRKAVDREIYRITKLCGFFGGELDVPSKIDMPQLPTGSKSLKQKIRF